MWAKAHIVLSIGLFGWDDLNALKVIFCIQTELSGLPKIVTPSDPARMHDHLQVI